jgi:ESAT-6 family protein
MSDILYMYDGRSLEEAVTDLGTCNTAILNDMHELEKYAKTALSTWTGAAQQQYEIHKTEWDKAMTQMTNVLADASSSVNNVHMIFDGAEDRNRKTWT